MHNVLFNRNRHDSQSFWVSAAALGLLGDIAEFRRFGDIAECYLAELLGPGDISEFRCFGGWQYSLPLLGRSS